MATYHQMGHDSWNLVTEKALQNFKGIILSPVNDAPADVIRRLQQLGKRRDEVEVILDPQFYEPSGTRGELPHWPYFSNDVDTVNLGDSRWWKARGEELVSVAAKIGANTICSPAILPRVYSDEYYGWVVKCADTLSKDAGKKGLNVLLTAIVRLSELAAKNRPEEIASILTSTDISRIYLVFSDDLPPRAQRTDIYGLAGAMSLIRLLEAAGSTVLVAFSGLDVLLWKAAGTTDVATGKFFNLRRFAPGRFGEDGPEGGRIVPYWTDNRLITWLREDDVRLLDRNRLIDRELAAENPYSVEILKIIDAGKGEAWVKYGWRQYLHWFQDIESKISSTNGMARSLLKEADSIWGVIGESDIYLYDRTNSGEWIRPWLNALKEAAIS